MVLVAALQIVRVVLMADEIVVKIVVTECWSKWWIISVLALLEVGLTCLGSISTDVVVVW